MNDEKKDAYDVGIPLEDLTSQESIDQEAEPAATNADVDLPEMASDATEDASGLPDLFDPEELAEVGLTGELDVSEDPVDDESLDQRVSLSENDEDNHTVIASGNEDRAATEDDFAPDGLTDDLEAPPPNLETPSAVDMLSDAAAPDAVVASDAPVTAGDEPSLQEAPAEASDDDDHDEDRFAPPPDDVFIDQDLLAGRLESLGLQIEELKREFEGKLKYDAHKDEIIDRLHTELQEYKQDIIKKYVLSIVMDVVKVADDIRKWLAYFRSLDVSQRDPRKLFRYVEAIPSDLEDVFYWHGVKPFSQQESAFDPSRQRAIKKIPTDDPALDKSVAHSIRPGYEWETKVIRQEMVAVYVHKQEQESLDTGMIDE